ncbi:MAG: glycoside hydrolase family 5 protein [Melioribacteraceae bacterium]|nr:glycoside hydrolase family 5 protein [Melioribacteraceae bacterium]
MISYTKYFIKSLIFVLCVGIIISCSSTKDTINEPEFQPLEDVEPFSQNEKLGRGINLGNALEAAVEGDWGVTLEESYFKVISDAGFNSVRIPIKWSAHAEVDSPFTIEESFFARIDWAILTAFKYNLAVIINIHHYEEMMLDPETEKTRLFALWQQIADHYQKYSHDLFFEVLNEPNDQLTPTLWNGILKEAVSVIRLTNPGRTILIGTANWGGLGGLNALSLPADDNIIVTYHYYNPFEFTHQGAEWVDGSESNLGTKWSNTPQERQAVINDFDAAIEWAFQKNVPLNMGEFGAYWKADNDSRALWTAMTSQYARLKGISFHYWEFCSGFGIYDVTESKFNEELLNSLLPSN